MVSIIININININTSVTVSVNFNVNLLLLLIIIISSSCRIITKIRIDELIIICSTRKQFLIRSLPPQKICFCIFSSKWPHGTSKDMVTLSSMTSVVIRLLTQTMSPFFGEIYLKFTVYRCIAWFPKNLKLNDPWFTDALIVRSSRIQYPFLKS